MRQNVFGQQIPLDPLNGDPYVWGRVDGDSLVVYGLIILDGRGYEVQQWVRTLIEAGVRGSVWELHYDNRFVDS
jgi:hypothetical protein